ncbi:MAG: hypothetical protein J6V44_13015 [Methanobrevibacter sp.]|nr:hypothetical protein [Methanobrevibacter sp.]MBO7696809.1 hypothetical protein [Methanobrevibacter sp.]
MQVNIDIDNTINDFIYKFRYYLNGIQATDKKYEIEDFNIYALSRATGLPEDVLNILFFKNNAFHATLDPLCGSKEVIRMLCENGHTIRFVSSISYDAIQSRLEFINKHFPYIYADDQLLITKDKSSVNADIVIDDHIKHIENVNPNCIFILFDQPWNQECDSADFRVKDWSEIKEVLERLGAL